jgi:hypothetical protein
MPKAPSTRATKRTGPYNLRAPVQRQSSASMAATLTSPVAPWTPHGTHMWNDPHMGYQQPAHHQPGYHDYMSVSAPAPLSPVTAPAHPNQSALWLDQEDTMLINAKNQGLGWNEIHKMYFPTKSGNACRKRHERLMTKLRSSDWDEARIAQVMAEYDRPGVREAFWGRIAAPFHERWEDVEKVVCFIPIHSTPMLIITVLPTGIEIVEGREAIRAPSRTISR